MFKTLYAFAAAAVIGFVPAVASAGTSAYVSTPILGGHVSVHVSSKHHGHGHAHQDGHRHGRRRGHCHTPTVIIPHGTHHYDVIRHGDHSHIVHHHGGHAVPADRIHVHGNHVHVERSHRRGGHRGHRH